MSSQVTKALATIPVAQQLVATYVSTNANGTVQVDFGQGEITVQPVGEFPRTPGDQVRVLRIDDSTVVLGPAVSHPPFGTIVSVGATTAVVSTDGGQVTLPWLLSYTPTIGDTVALVGGWILGKASGLLTSLYRAPGAPNGGGAFTQEFRATDSGTWYLPSGRYTRAEVYAVGTGSNIGAWFYGTSIADTIPDGATIQSVEIYTVEIFNHFPTTLTRLGTHGLQTKSGLPVVGSTATIAAGSGWKTLPTAMGDLLKTGAKYGIGTDVSGEAMYTSRSADAESGKLRIKYTV